MWLISVLTETYANKLYIKKMENNFEPRGFGRNSGQGRRQRYDGRTSGDANHRQKNYNSSNSYGNRDNRNAGYGNRYERNDRYNSRREGDEASNFEQHSYNRNGYRSGNRYNNNYGKEGFERPQQRGGYRKSDNQDGDSQQRYGNNRERSNYRSYNSDYKKDYNSDYKKNYNNTYEKRNRTEDYDPNAKYSRKKQIEYKKQFVDYSEPMRLNKYLANSGICSRREADEYIAAGVVTVNGEIVTELGTKIIPATDKVMFHNEPVKIERKVYILLNKPKDCVTTVEDTHDRLTVLDIVKNACTERVYPVGRLDRNTTGVLLITNDGDLATKLTHPKYDKKKIYQVTLDKEISDEDFEQILSGITLEDGFIKVDEMSFVKEGDRCTLGVEIHSGRNRIVRRIFDHLGYKVTRLDRVYFAGLTKKNLPRGRWRFLSEMEVNMLKMTASAMKD